MDTTSFDAIVIGSGLGGSVASAVLAHEGYSVLLLEKNSQLGGVCGYYQKAGFHVDVGTHMFTRGHKGPFGTIARRVGARLPRFVRTPILTELNNLGARVEIPRDLLRYPPFFVRLVRELRLSPKDVREATAFFYSILTISEAEIRELESVPMWDFVTRYTKNPHMVGMFGLLLGLYFILHLREVSAGEGVWCFQQMMRDQMLSYPKGGAYKVPTAFTDAAAKHGATIKTRSSVKKILVEQGRATGVLLADGTQVKAPIVIATTGLKDVVGRLTEQKHFPDAYVERIQALRPSLIAVQAKIALNKKLIRAGSLVGCHSESLSLHDYSLHDFDAMYSAVMEGRIPHIIPIYAPVPSNFDTTLAPPGCQLITACAVAPTTDIPLQDPPEHWVSAMMDTLRHMIPKLDKHTMWVDTMGVASIGNIMGKHGAPAISCGQTIDQVGNHRPPVRTPVPGLYVGGCGAGARGVGTELAATSGEIAADAAIQDYVNGMLGHRRISNSSD